MSSQSTTARSIIYVGMDVHKDSITLAVLPAAAKDSNKSARAARTINSDPLSAATIVRMQAA
jgi:hypothetical protein